jgi:hypothetical protein
MDYDRLIAAAEHYTLPKAAAHYRRLRDAAAQGAEAQSTATLAVERRRALAARIAAQYGFRLSDVDPDGAAIAQLVRLLEKDL